MSSSEPVKLAVPALLLLLCFVLFHIALRSGEYKIKKYIVSFSLGYNKSWD